MRILAVHGYEIYKGGKLGELAEAICKKVIAIQNDYSHIILLGGWHLKEAGSFPTINVVMAKYLVQHEVPSEKIYTQYTTIRGAFRPPRDSMEEIDLLPTILRELGCTPRETPFDTICISYFAPRLRFLYRSRRARCERIIRVAPPNFHLRRMLEQIPAYIITRLDPNGTSTIIQKNRKERTLSDGWFKENIPWAWLA